MSFFKSMFGSSKPPPVAAPTINEAITKQKIALEQIDKKLLLLNHRYEQERAKAKVLASGKKSRTDPKLKSCLRKMKQQEGQIDSLENQRSNLETQMNSLDSLDMSRVMMEAVRTANAATRAQMQTMNPDEVGDVIDDANEMHEDVEEISTILGEAYGANATMDDDELLDDFMDQLTDDEDDLGIADAPIDFPTVSQVEPLPRVPVTQPVAARPVAVDDDEDEFARLAAEMEF